MRRVDEVREPMTSISEPGSRSSVESEPACEHNQANEISNTDDSSSSTSTSSHDSPLQRPVFVCSESAPVNAPSSSQNLVDDVHSRRPSSLFLDGTQSISGSGSEEPMQVCPPPATKPTLRSSALDKLVGKRESLIAKD